MKDSGRLILMNWKEFTKTFVKKYDHNNYEIIVVSDEIKSEGKYNNVTVLKRLLPSPYSITEFVKNGLSKKYYKNYSKQLCMKENIDLLTIVAKTVAIDCRDTIILIGPNEKQYGYLEVIGQFLYDVFEIKPIMFKEFHKGTEVDSIFNRKKTNKLVKAALDNVDMKNIKRAIMTEASVKEKLLSMKKKELYKVAYGYDIDPEEYSNKKLIKILTKRILK